MVHSDTRAEEKTFVTTQISVNESNTSWHFIRNVLVKAFLLFILLNLIFALWYPLPTLGKVSFYNLVFPGRQRLPYGDNPDLAYNLSLFDLEAMFRSHEISSGNKPANEYRVILIGDSSTWGFLLPTEETLTAKLNASKLQLPDGRQVRAYNLGYPVMSLTKDLLMLSKAMAFEPDMIVWSITLESFPTDKQLYPPILQHNPETVRALIDEYGLNLDPFSDDFVEVSIQDRTIIGARRSIADLFRLQLYGVPWAATRIDQYIPDTFTPRIEDLDADDTFHEMVPPYLDANDLAMDVLSAGLVMSDDIPLIIINEPMFVSQGKNSDIRYNFFYPRWAYDDYRALIQQYSQENDWYYFDMWDVVPSSEFTNSAVHLTAKGNEILAQKVADAIMEVAQHDIAR